jgi:hypothetical protein
VNIQNKKVLDVTGGRDDEGQNVQVYSRHNKINQRWRIVYLDKAGKRPTKGRDTNFGFHINRPFYIRSRLPMKRIAELVSSDVRLRRWNKGRKKQQTWRFDGISKTLKSMYQTSWSMEIPNQGRNNQLRATTTSSRWW